VLLGIIGPGTCFGELGLLASVPSIYTVIAYSDVYALRVTEGRMGDFIQENHASVMQIMKNMANTMIRMQKQIMLLQNELSIYSKDKDELNEAKKDIIRSIYNPKAMNMRGKMHFLGNNTKKT
jgi:CRP-like cAMP-binding protein